MWTVFWGSGGDGSHASVIFWKWRHAQWFSLQCLSHVLGCYKQLCCLLLFTVHEEIFLQTVWKIIWLWLPVYLNKQNGVTHLQQLFFLWLGLHPHPWDWVKASYNTWASTPVIVEAFHKTSLVSLKDWCVGFVTGQSYNWGTLFSSCGFCVFLHVGNCELFRSGKGQEACSAMLLIATWIPYLHTK